MYLPSQVLHLTGQYNLQNGSKIICSQLTKLQSTGKKPLSTGLRANRTKSIEDITVEFPRLLDTPGMVGPNLFLQLQKVQIPFYCHLCCNNELMKSIIKILDSDYHID